MLAISRDRGRAFIHDPDNGFAVPFIIDLKKKTKQIAFPSVEELENDYAVFDEADDAIELVAAPARKLIADCQELSRVYTAEFGDAIGQMTVADLRKRIGKTGGEWPRIAVAPAGDPYFSRETRKAKGRAPSMIGAVGRFLGRRAARKADDDQAESGLTAD